MMNTTHLPFFIVLCAGPIVLIQTKLTAVNDSYHAGYLYWEVKRNTNIRRVAHQEEESTSDICNDVMSSGYFDSQGIDPVNMNFDDSTPEEHVSAWRRAQEIRILPFPTSITQERPGGYFYARVIFEGYRNDMYTSGKPVNERVMICLGKKRYTEDPPLAYYVTKEFNLMGYRPVSLFDFLLGLPLHKVGRFIFKPVADGLPLVALAEQAADVYTAPDFNVEIQYIQKKDRHSTAPIPEIDPLCRLISLTHIALNQHERLCVAVLSSSYFEGRERYSQKPRFQERCIRRQIAFQSEPAIRVMSNTPGAPVAFYEWMLECRAVLTGNVYHLSRAYSSDHLFVYTGTGPDSSVVYLENISFRVTIEDVGND